MMWSWFWRQPPVTGVWEAPTCHTLTLLGGVLLEGQVCLQPPLLFSDGCHVSLMLTTLLLCS